MKRLLNYLRVKVKIEKEISKADNLMKEGKKEEAKFIVEQLIQENPSQKALYQDAINIYLYGKMFTEVKNIFQLYTKNFGRKLTGVDFSLKDIVKVEEENKEYLLAKVKVFKRLSIGGRGHVTNYQTFFPVKEIQIYDDKIVLKVYSKEYHYKWNEVVDASILRRKAYKYKQGDTIQKLFILRNADRTFKFDVSEQFSDFRNSDILVSEFKKHVNVKEREMNRMTSCGLTVRSWMAYIIFCAILVSSFKLIFLIANLLEKLFSK